MERCYNCMNEITEGKKCSKCGFVNTEHVPSHRLKPGTMLSGRYYLGNALGEGGFGITYIGFDTRLEMKVAVKEFFPSGFVTRYIKDSATVEVSNAKNNDFFKSGKDQFLREARMIARFSNESGIVDVRDFFEENGTAYIVMEYIEGKNLKVYMREHGLFKPDAILNLIKPIMDALEKVHSVGLIHRDISPDNIMFTKDSRLKLMDFGAAKNTDIDNTARGSIILKPGYAPPEQYRRDETQGAWTDVYALCATIYKCITGVTPDESTLRENDDNLKSISEYGGVFVNPQIEQAIMDGLNPNISKRIKSVSELKERIYSHIYYNQQDMEDPTTALYVDDNAETMVISENFAQLKSNDESNKEKITDGLKPVVAIDEKKEYDNERSLSDSSERNKPKNKTKIYVISGIVAIFLVVCAISVFIINIKNSTDDGSYMNNYSSSLNVDGSENDNDKPNTKKDSNSSAYNKNDNNKDTGDNNTNSESTTNVKRKDGISYITNFDEALKFDAWKHIGDTIEFSNAKVYFDSEVDFYCLDFSGFIYEVLPDSSIDVSNKKGETISGKAIITEKENDDESSSISFDITELY